MYINNRHVKHKYTKFYILPYGGVCMVLFGLRLKTLRQERKMTQQQLAERLDLTKASVSGYEQSSIYPSVEVLIQISQYFNVSADYLIGLSDSMEFKMSHLTDEQISLLLGIITQFERLNNMGLCKGRCS